MNVIACVCVCVSASCQNATDRTHTTHTHSVHRHMDAGSDVHKTQEVDTLCTLVDDFRPHHRKHGELEVRLGTVDAVTGNFTTGVGISTFEQLERDMSDVLSCDRVWREIVDYYYLNAEGGTIRTRVTFDNERMAMESHHIEKKTLSQAIVVRSDDPTDAARIVCSVETPVHSPPTSALINYTRVKQQKRFTDCRDGNVVWNFELSKTWSAPTRDAVEYQQHHTEPTYEVECELVDTTGTYMSQKSTSDVAASLLMKMKMLLGEEVDGRVHILPSSHKSKPTVSAMRRSRGKCSRTS